MLTQSTKENVGVMKNKKDKDKPLKEINGGVSEKEREDGET